MDALAFVPYIQLGPTHGHVGEFSSGAYPELHGEVAGAVDDKGVGLLVVDSCSLNISHVGAVAKLCE